MELTLEPIKPKEDNSEARYASDNCQQLLNMWKTFYPTIGYNPPWTGYFIKENEQIIGSCALIFDPSGKRAEVSYWTFPEHEGKGTASLACKKLIRIAGDSEPKITIFAKTAPEENASTRVLQKNGFEFSGVVQDHEIGDAWEWMYRLQNLS